jgi:hypothetical protein
VDGSGVDALDLIPEVYAQALRLEAAGLTPEGIAARLGIEPGALGTLLEIARAKLVHAQAARHEPKAE